MSDKSQKFLKFYMLQIQSYEREIKVRRLKGHLHSVVQVLIQLTF